MLQLKNNTPFNPAIAVFPNEDGIDALYVIINGTFHISLQLAVAGEQVLQNRSWLALKVLTLLLHGIPVRPLAGWWRNGRAYVGVWGSVWWRIGSTLEGVFPKST